MCSVFEGKKTTTFYVGLVALGFALNYLSFFLYNQDNRIYVLSAVVFFAIGLYVMSKGIEKQSTSNIA